MDTYMDSNEAAELDSEVVLYEYPTIGQQVVSAVVVTAATTLVAASMYAAVYAGYVGVSKIKDSISTKLAARKEAQLARENTTTTK